MLSNNKIYSFFKWSILSTVYVAVFASIAQSNHVNADSHIGDGFIFSAILSTSLDKEPIKPIPLPKPMNTAKVALGKRLFNETRLDPKQKIACSTCHDIKHGGTDNAALSKTAQGGKTKVNTPTIFNVTLNDRYYWSGKFNSLKNQTDDALSELNTNWNAVLKTLKSMRSYRNQFNSIYPDGITTKNIKDAIINFEFSLNTPNSRFDNYLRGKPQAINGIEKKGYQLFKVYGCITCHQGINVGGNFIQEMTHVQTNVQTKAQKNGEHFAKKTTHPSVDIKKGTTTRNIRVPSLRNVSLTYPYFHDGSIKTLEQAVQIMALKHAGKQLTEHETYNIVMFLNSLTGQYNGQSL